MVKLNAIGERVFHVRCVIGGNISYYTGGRYSDTADVQTFNLLCNTAVSERAHLAMGEIHDFYLIFDHERPEFMWL